ncbi:hypothetical protein JXA88_17035 [Candidatus Fermentibacteria bacterium]|nr:hypothetical protein [Candidatus Fermentibacteria bacterium]
MRKHESHETLCTAASLTTAAFLFLIATFLLAAPSLWASSELFRILSAVGTLAGAVMLVVPVIKPGRSAPSRALPPASRPHTTVEPGPGEPVLSRSHITSQDLLKTAAEQKKTIEDLRATVQEQEKQLAGMRLQSGVEAEGKTIYLWSQEYFRRVLEVELWRSRRMQRPMSLLLIDFADEVAQSRSLSRAVGSVDSSIWQYYAETVCRAVRGGDHVGLVYDGTLCVLLTETSPDESKVAKDRIAKLIEKERQRDKAPSKIALAVDTALVGFPGDGKDLDELLKAGQKIILRAQRDRRMT